MSISAIRRFARDDSGQAILEFMLLMLVMISVVTFLKVSVRNLTVRLWSGFGKKIGAACAGCDAGTDFDL